MTNASDRYYPPPTDVSGFVTGIAAGDGIIVDDSDPQIPVVINDGVITAIAGDGITVDDTDPQNPVISNDGVLSIVPGDGIVVDNTDPQNPIVTSTALAYAQALAGCEILGSGLAVPNRRDVVGAANGATMTSGNLRLSYFVAPVTQTYTGVRVVVGTVPATLASLSRIGVFSVNTATGDITLIAAITNDTTLYATGSSSPARAFTSGACNLVAGQTYAIGQLSVQIGTAAIISALSPGGSLSDEYAVAPRISGIVTAQADLPAIGASILAASILTQAVTPYCALTF